MAIDKKKCLNIFDLVLNLSTFVLILISVIAFFAVGGRGNMAVWGPKCFKYFTVDSNLLNALVCGVYAVFNILYLKGKTKRVPRALTIMRFIGTTSVAYTFFVVLCLLLPATSFAKMYSGMNFFMHFLCPVMSMISFMVLERDGEILKWQKILGLIPIALYGTTYLVLVVFMGVMDDFYYFNINGLWPITYPVLICAGTLLSIGLAKLHNRLVK